MPPFQPITSRENPLCKQIVKLLRSSRFRRETGLTVLEGLRLCVDAARSGARFPALVVSRRLASDPEIDCLAAAADACYLLDDDLFARLADTVSPQGVLCLLRLPQTAFSLRTGGYYLALERVQDPSNLGAMSRTAEALGLDGLLLSDDTCDPFAPKSLRASMGALLRLPVCCPPDFYAALEQAPVPVYACVAQVAQPVTAADFSRGAIACIGNEANGLSDRVKKLADARVTVPMAGRAESLNAAAAAAIVLWEMVRGRS